MRRGYQYTTGDTPITAGSDRDYLEVYDDKPWTIRLVWKISAALWRKSLVRYAREKLIEDLERDLAETDVELYNRDNRSMTKRFFRGLEDVQRHVQSVRAVSAHAFDSRRPELLRFIVSELQPDVDINTRQSGRLDFPLSAVLVNPLAESKRTVELAVRQSLLPIRDAGFESSPGPYWTALDVLRDLVDFPLSSLFRTPSLEKDGQVPLRVMTPALIRIEHLAERCRRSLNESTLGLLDRWNGEEPGFGWYTKTVNRYLQSVARLRIPDLLRLGLADPRATFHWIHPDSDRFEETVSAYYSLVMTNLTVYARQQARKAIGFLLGTDRGLPDDLPGGAITATLNFLADEETGRHIRSLFEYVIDGEFVDSATAVRLHQALSLLEQARNALEKMFTPGEDRKSEVDDALERIDRSIHKPVLRGQKRRIYLLTISRRVEPLITELGNALISIHTLLDKEEDHPARPAVSTWKEVGTGLINLMRLEYGY
jgi:hypothetical protein